MTAVAPSTSDVTGVDDRNPALTVADLGKRYGSHWALRHCSFAVPTGSVVALVGSNGAGKTTLLSLLAGMTMPTEGTVRVGGVAPAERFASPSLAARTATVTHDRPLYGGLTPAQLLDFGRRLNRYWDQTLAEGWLRAFDVPLDRRCRKLSAGQRTQVTLALALGSQPALLLLDEPLANLDPVVRTEVSAGLLAVAADIGTTIVLSTHVTAELSGVADQLLLLDHGRLILDGPIDAVLDAHVRMTGPAGTDAPALREAVHVRTSGRQTTALVRRASTGSTTLVPAGWRATPVTLDDLVDAYLRGFRGTAQIDIPRAAPRGEASR